MIMIGLYVKLYIKYTKFTKTTKTINIEQVLIENQKQIVVLEDQLKDHEAMLKVLQNSLRATYSKMKIYKYNAFEGLGGQMSAIIVLLNDHLDGMLLHSVHSGESNHLYVKSIEKGLAKQTLSKEESNILKETIK